MPAKAKSYEVPGLLPGHKYAFRVRPLGEEDLSPEVVSSFEYMGTPLLMDDQSMPPRPPQGPLLISKIGSNSAMVRWLPPAAMDIGGSPLIAYVIEIKEVDRDRWRREAVVSGVTTSHILRNLSPGSSYQVRVIAKNRDGDSAPLVASEVISVGGGGAFQVPSAPTMLKISRVTGDSVALRWQPPANDGGLEITQYVVLMRRKPADIWEEAKVLDGYSTSCVVGGLREGGNYYFAVFAVNDCGRSDQLETTLPTQLLQRRSLSRRPSLSKLTISPLGPLVVTAFSQDSVSLSWLPYTGENIGAVSSYRIEMREAGKINWDYAGTVDATEASYVVRGLREGTDYQFRVLAENASGSTSPPLLLDKPFMPKHAFGEMLFYYLYLLYLLLT